MDFNKLIDAALQNANLKSDYALHKATGIPQNILSAIRKGKRHPSVTEATQLATLAGLNEMDVIAYIELHTAKTPAKKQFWKSYTESRGITACVSLTALAIAIAMTPTESEAGILQSQNYGESVRSFSNWNIHYAHN